MNIFHCHSCTSTNTLAKSLIREGVCDGQSHHLPVEFCLAIIADQQTGGYGTQGKSWLSQKGGLYLSAIYWINEQMQQNSGPLALLAGLAVVHTFQDLKIQNITLKWPNDVQINGKKVAGILIEKEQSFSVMGIGINVFNTVKEILSQPVTSLFEEGYSVSIQELRNQILQNLSNDLLLSQNEAWPQWKSFCPNINHTITRNGITGRFVDLGLQGEMILEDAQGRLHKICTVYQEVR